MASDKIDHILTPETEKHLFTDQILPFLVRGEAVTAVWLPHGGQRTQMAYLTKNFSSFGFDKLGKCKFIYLNPYELPEESSEGYFQLMLYQLDPDYKEKQNHHQNYYFILLNKIKKKLDQGYHLVFILGDFNKLNFSTTFFNNLQSLKTLDKVKIHFIFAFTQSTTSLPNNPKYGQLLTLLFQNFVYFPLLGEEDASFTLERLIRKYNHEIWAEEKKLIQNLSGGHPSLLKACMRIIDNH
ncbi:MAG: hypothetical protein M1514_02240, partial [Patescibacteria group bacterium]|nr:hypothetical protein [Patescibacteria group bacterium]